MIYFNFLFENFKQNKFIANINKNKFLILWVIISFIIAIGFWNALNSQEFKDLMLVNSPANNFIQGSVDTNFETKGVVCDAGNVWIDFKIYSENGISYKNDDYNIEIYINDMLEYQHTKNIIADVGGMILHLLRFQKQ